MRYLPLVLGFCALTSSVCYGADGDLDGAKTPNGAALYDWIQILGIQHNAQEAYTKYYLPDFVQHNLEPAAPRAAGRPAPAAPDPNVPARERLIKGDGAVLAVHPELRMTVEKIFVSGDFVYMAYNRTSTDIPGGKREYLAMYLMKNGKVAETWNLARLLPDSFTALPAK